MNGGRYWGTHRNWLKIKGHSFSSPAPGCSGYQTVTNVEMTILPCVWVTQGPSISIHFTCDTLLNLHIHVTLDKYQLLVSPMKIWIRVGTIYQIGVQGMKLITRLQPHIPLTEKQPHPQNPPHTLTRYHQYKKTKKVGTCNTPVPYLVTSNLQIFIFNLKMDNNKKLVHSHWL